LTEDIRVILVGFGVIGRALANILASRAEEFEKPRGLTFRVVAVIDRSGAAVDGKGLDIAKLLERKSRTGRVGRRSKSATEVIEEIEADVIVELTPGNPLDAEPGLSHIKAAIAAGKHVVTANKMPLAHGYAALMAAAGDKGLQLRYSACVGAGLPILDFGEACAVSEPVVRVEGVLNATSNFILSEMENDGARFGDALEKAKRLGYAESNPWLDIDGVDAAAKIVIIGNHVLGRRLSMRDVRVVEGIRRVSRARVKKLKEEGKRVRLVAYLERRPEVRLVELPANHVLSIEGASNAVKFLCKYSGERVVSGLAAGGTTTSSAVMRDLLRVGGSTRNQ